MVQWLSSSNCPCSVGRSFVRPAMVTSDQISTFFNIYSRVSQKIQKSEFWNVTYPSGFHRLDEPPEKISKYAKYAYLGAYLGARNMVKSKIFGRFPHCNYNVKLKIAGKMSFMGL